MDDFSKFADDVLIAAGELQKKFDQRSVDLSLVLKEVPYDVPSTWTEQVLSFLEKSGAAKSESTYSKLRIRVSGYGYAKISKIKHERTPPTLAKRLTSDRTQKLLNVGAFGVSIVSLVVAIVALFKAS